MQHSVILLETFASNLVSLTCPSLQILGKTETGVFSIFRFLANPLYPKNVITCHNRTCHDIDMKLGPAIKVDKRSNGDVKKFNDYVISENCDVILLFPIYGQFAAIWKPNLHFSLTITFYLTKTENKTKKSVTQLSYYCFE